MLPFPDINPIIISFGPLAVSWYSLSYVVGILLGWQYIIKLIEKKYSTLEKQHVDDFVTWVIIGIILGGRLGYVLFYDPVKYLSNPIEILKTYEGGMSFHGGVIGFVIASFIFTRKNKIKYFTLVDMVAASAPIAIFLGRIANFINAELYGRITDAPWAFIFPGSDGMPRHPSQLYESAMEGFALFFILYFCITKYKALKKPGLVSGIFLILYSIFRLIIENFREPDAHIGFHAEFITRGQLLCLPMLITGIILIKYSKSNAN
jgi:phosphatidylglycerol---prolipoprotein diacylglyceryl transferase